MFSDIRASDTRENARKVSVIRASLSAYSREAIFARAVLYHGGYLPTLGAGGNFFREIEREIRSKN